MWLYKLTNKMNGKAYIGVTRRASVFRRVSQHASQAKQGKSTLIAQAIREFGIAAFIVEILSQAETREELSRMEMDAIREHRTMFPDGYNRTIGGENPRPRSGFRLSTSHRRKLREAHLGLKHSHETCEKISLAKRGKPHAPHSQRTKSRIKKALMGHVISQETRNKIAATLRKYNAARLEKEIPISEKSIP